MDPRTNPYAPGAGNPPPELVGRDEIIEKVFIELDRCRNGFSHRSFLMVGLRGVGKTVLLNHLATNAEADGFAIVSIETPEKRSLPALLAPALRSALLRLDHLASASHMAKKAYRVLASFIGGMKLKYNDLEVSVDIEKEPGLADSGDLESDLIDLFVQIGLTVKSHKTALVLFIDEIQYIKETEFAALIMALHKCSQKQLPVSIIGAGLPQLVGQAGKAKSYAERLFLYPEIGPLNKQAAKKAVTAPALRQGVKYTKEALDEILLRTKGYPYFLQEWGRHCWRCAEKSPINGKDSKRATRFAIDELDTSFFRVRFDRLTPGEKRYLRAMAELGSGPYRSGDIAHILKKEVQAVAPIRASLINKGMIYSPDHGDNSFTVPLFDGYMKRVMPELEI